MAVNEEQDIAICKQIIQLAQQLLQNEESEVNTEGSGEQASPVDGLKSKLAAAMGKTQG